MPKTTRPHNPELAVLIEEFRAAIEHANRTQLEVANELGISPSTINTWLRGHHQPTRKCVQRAIRAWIDDKMSQPAE